MAQLKKTTKEVSKKIDQYEFGQALHIIYDFFWHEFCDKYIEESKKNTNAAILLKVLADSLKLLHPFMPFITEKIWQEIPAKSKKLLIIETWPSRF